MVIVTIVIGALMLVAGFSLGWAFGFEHCAKLLDDWDDADWQEVQDDD